MTGYGAGAVNLDQRFGLDRRRGERQECRSKNGSFHRFLRKLCTRPGARNGTCSTTPNASGAMFQKNESSQNTASWASRRGSIRHEDDSAEPIRARARAASKRTLSATRSEEQPCAAGIHGSWKLEPGHPGTADRTGAWLGRTSPDSSVTEGNARTGARDGLSSHRLRNGTKRPDKARIAPFGGSPAAPLPHGS